MRQHVFGFAFLFWSLNAWSAEPNRIITLPAGQTLQLLPVTSASAMLKDVTFKAPVRELVLTDTLGKQVWISAYMVYKEESAGLHAAALLDPDTLAVVCRHQDHIWLHVYQRVGNGWGEIQAESLDLVMDPVSGIIRGARPRFDHGELPDVKFLRNIKGKVSVVFPSGERLPPRRVPVVNGRLTLPGPDED